MRANAREDVDAVVTGDIAAGIGFKNTRTGDSLSAPGSEIVLENLEFPEPVIHVAVEPKTKVDQDKMGKALFALSEEDPDRKSVVWGKSVTVRVDLGGRRFIKKKT